MSKNEMRLECHKVIQSGLEFYTFVINSSILKKIVFVSRRDHVINPEGYQRAFSTKRIKEVGEYIKKPRASFPNTIIINLDPGKARFESSQDSNRGTLVISKEEGVAWVIDGQHRILGFNHSDNKEFDLIVAAYIGLSITDQASIFKIINSTQKGVNMSLIYDLIDLTKDADYADTRAHEIVKSLNKDNDSPWKDEIKMLGTGPGLITQSALITEIKRILKNPIFKEYDAGIQISILKDFFGAIKELFPNAWGSKKYVLCKTLGVGAFMRILPTVLILCRIQTDFTKERMKEVLQDITKVKMPSKTGGTQFLDFSSEQMKGIGGVQGQIAISEILEEKLPPIRPP